jgi:hypothetical protein
MICRSGFGCREGTETNDVVVMRYSDFHDGMIIILVPSVFYEIPTKLLN